MTTPDLRATLRSIAVGGAVRDCCPDCDADSTLVEVAAGVFSLTVAHDDTCPTWGRINRAQRRGQK